MGVCDLVCVQAVEDEGKNRTRLCKIRRNSCSEIERLQMLNEE